MKRPGNHGHQNERAGAARCRAATEGVSILRAICLGLALQGVAFCKAHGLGQHVRPTDPPMQLCMQEVHESSLTDFEPVGLSIDEASGSDPAVTMWSRTELLVIRLSADEPTIGSTFRAALSGTQPIGAALTRWNGGAPVVELFDASDETIWTVEFASSEAAETRVPLIDSGRSLGSAGGASALGVLRTETGWVRAQRVTDPFADTSAIVLSGSKPVRAGRDPALPAPASETAKVPSRRIDRILHVRPGSNNGALVTEAAFPFTVVEFTSDGSEVWRVSPAPDELRDQLGEADLRYVIATPAIKVGHAVLNTVVALRSGRRVSTLWLPNATAPRYREIPGDFSFLGAFPRHRLLVATRSGRPYRLILFSWHWTDQGQSCTHAPT